MKLFLIAALFLVATSATGSSVGDIVQAMLPYCTHGQMRREVKAALEECSASCSSDETATQGYFDATTDGYYWDEATTHYWDEGTTAGDYWNEATTAGDYWDEATTAGDYWDEATTARDYWDEATTAGDYWDEATTAGDYWDEATTDGYYWDEATTAGDYWDEATTNGYYWDEATTDGYHWDEATTAGYYGRSLSDKKFRKMFKKQCPATHYMQNKFYGGDLSAYKVLACVEERMNAVSDDETLRSGATLRYGCAGNIIRSGAAVRSGCEEVNDCIYRFESQILAEPDWCSAGLDVFPMVTAMCNSIAFMDSCFDHMRQQFVETNGYLDQTTTTAYYAPDGAGPVRSLH